MKRGPILVTGGSGFLGRAVAEVLEQSGREAVLAARTASPGVRACDLRDARAARALLAATQPASVIHLAGQPDASGTELWRAHVTTTTSLLDAAARLAEPPRVLVVGSAAEYGDGAGGRPATESTPARPLSAYGSAKLAQTLAALSYRHRGVPVLVARVFNVVGPRMPERLSLGSFARQIARAERGLQPPELRIGNLSAKRDYVDVRDAARALVAILERGVPGGIYNVCTGRARSTQELLGELLSHSRVRVAVVRDRARRQTADLKLSVGDFTRLRSLGWRPRIPIASSLVDTLAWHRRAVIS